MPVKPVPFVPAGATNSAPPAAAKGN